MWGIERKREYRDSWWGRARGRFCGEGYVIVFIVSGIRSRDLEVVSWDRWF